MFGAGSCSKRKRSKEECGRRRSLILKFPVKHFSYLTVCPLSLLHFSLCPVTPNLLSLPLSLTLSLLSSHSCVLPSDIALPLLNPLPHYPPPCLCGTGCFTSTVLTLTAPSLWRLIFFSDTLSLYHVNGPAHPLACVCAISTSSKTPGEQRETD